jgi:hypothetical protein
MSDVECRKSEVKRWKSDVGTLNHEREAIEP